LLGEYFTVHKCVASKGKRSFIRLLEVILNLELFLPGKLMQEEEKYKPLIGSDFLKDIQH
jgi:hypothetical protein